MFEQIKIVVAVVGVVIFGLSLLARRMPEVAWLQHFRFDAHLTEEQKTRMRRRANVHVGVELILLGFAIPLGHVLLTVMTFSAMTASGMTIAIAASLLCIGLGITAIVRRG